MLPVEDAQALAFCGEMAERAERAERADTVAVAAEWLTLGLEAASRAGGRQASHR